MSYGYDLKTPCPNCPFRTDVKPYLRADRVEGLEMDLVAGQGSFTCHKTTVEGEADADGASTMVNGPKAQHCAGAMILLEKIEQPNQMMRISERLGLYDRSRLDMDAPVFDSFRAMKKAQPDYEEEETAEEPCSVVGYGCEAPAGFLVGGVVKHGTENAAYHCNECGEPVCGSCSKDRGSRRICDSCAEWGEEEDRV